MNEQIENDDRIKLPRGWVRQKVRCKDGRLQWVKMNRIRAIKLYCTECMRWEGKTANCPSTLCPLWAYRGNTTLTYKGSCENIQNLDIETK